MVDEFTKIIPSAFGPFIGHHQMLLARVKSVLKEDFKFFITLQNYVNTELDKTELLMNLKNRTLSTEIEYYQEYAKKHFKPLSLFSKLILLILFFYM